MAYARAYDLIEVKGLLSIIEGSANGVVNNNQPAHSGARHSEQTQADLAARSRGRRGPRDVSTYKDFDTLVAATHEALNSPQGQAALGLLDGGSQREGFRAPLGGGYFASKTHRDGGRATGTITNEPFVIATEAFVLVLPWIGGKLWIQTSYPSQVNARAVPTLAALP